MSEIERAGGEGKRIVPSSAPKDPAFGRPGWLEVREQRRQRRAVVHQVAIEAIVARFRLLSANEAHDLQVEMHMEKLDKIQAELAKTDDPLRREVLNRSLQHWLDMSERILNEIY